MNTFLSTSPTIKALWRLRAMALFFIGPVAGVVLVQLIFGLPKILWWSAGGMGLFMLSIFLILVLKEREIIIKQSI